LGTEIHRPVSDSRVPSFLSEFYNCLFGQQISGLLKNSKLRYHIYISQKQYPILNQTNAIYVTPPHVFKTPFKSLMKFCSTSKRNTVQTRQVDSRVKYSGSYSGDISLKFGQHTDFCSKILHGFPQYLHEITGKNLKLEQDCFFPHLSSLIIGSPITQPRIASFKTSFF